MHNNHRSDFNPDAGVGVKFLNWPRFHRVEVRRLLNVVPAAVSGSAPILYALPSTLELRLHPLF